ncbi:MAG: thioredoxin domain-containing protein, partial [Anaerolineales bacterium]
RAERREKAKRQKQMQSIGIIILGVLVIVGGAVLISFLQPKVDAAPERSYTTENGASVGNPDAPVVVEVFSSFTCIHCNNYASDTEHQVIEQYAETGQIYYTYRAFSNAIDDAGIAAQAAFCAGDQGKFWEMHDTIFANFSYNYPRKLLTQMATSIGVEDMDAFEACIDNGKYVDQIESDVALGQAAGITGTPSFTINGEMVMEGNQPLATFQQQIEAALAAANN